MKNDHYEIEKNLEMLYRGKSTGFINNYECRLIIQEYKKNNYHIYSPYKDADKVIIYTDSIPDIRLYKIISKDTVCHSSILGSLFGLKILPWTFGDIVFYQGNFYVYLVSSIADYVVNNMNKVGNIHVHLEEVCVNYLEDYQREYEDIEIIVSSFRIDTIISKLISGNRKMAKEFIYNKLVLVNYEIVEKIHFLLKIGDIFSIRGYGKYIFSEICGKTKKDNYIIILKKYV